MASGSAAHAAIARLVAAAREQGEPDVYAAKRRWPRYAIGMPIEFTMDPQCPTSAGLAVTHNISGGGVGFWSHRELAAETAVWIHQSEGEPRAIWLPGTVAHCTRGIRGYLIGVRFDLPAPQDISATDSARRRTATPDGPAGMDTQPRLAPRRVSRLSLATKCGCWAALAAGACVTV
ncbi:MAG: PilZ domain-containing protein, partial [Planctomycetota bacterium]